MLELQDDSLRVELLDPVADAARLGPRFCWGGYVWQVHDRVAGALLTGPEWPNPAPSAFNGQGLPESFRHRTLDGEPLTWNGTQGLAVGAGRLELDREGNPQVVAPCRWTMGRLGQSLEFVTRHGAAGLDYELTRAVTLAGRELHSQSRLVNLSTERRLKLQWFAHPFFPVAAGGVRADLPMTASLPENAGFSLDHGRLTQKRRFTHRDDGHMERGLRLPPGETFFSRLEHPVLGHVHFQTHFAPDSFVIWGNDRTFSFEPYLSLDLAPGEVREWGLLYRF